MGQSQQKYGLFSEGILLAHKMHSVLNEAKIQGKVVSIIKIYLIIAGAGPMSTKIWTFSEGLPLLIKCIHF
jgi:hypothetical protein